MVGEPLELIDVEARAGNDINEITHAIENTSHITQETYTEGSTLCYGQGHKCKQG
jgi:hypothetical protein